MNNSYSAGGYIKAWCPRCNLKSDHTIIAMVDNLPKKIKCNSCDEHHNLSAKQSGKSRTASKSTIRKSDQVIDHLKFGIGIVLSVIQINKIEILFKDGPKLLIQNQ
jgi:hypothetical protein